MSFRTWLQTKEKEDSPIGDLARDAAMAGWDGNSASDLWESIYYIACPEALAALKEAALEFGTPLDDEEFDEYGSEDEDEDDEYGSEKEDEDDEYDD